jgi:hypothetical protein
MLAGVATLWAIRSAGVHHTLRLQAFKHRNDWAAIEQQRYLPADAPHQGEGAALIAQLRRNAIDMRVPSPVLLGEWPNRWWGD